MNDGLRYYVGKRKVASIFFSINGQYRKIWMIKYLQLCNVASVRCENIH